MALARYIRLSALQVAEGTMSLNGLTLAGPGGTVPCTWAAPSAPVSGSLAALSDGDPSTACGFDGAGKAGFRLTADCGAPSVVDRITFGNAAGALRAVSAQWSSDGVEWSDARRLDPLGAGDATARLSEIEVLPLNSQRQLVGLSGFQLTGVLSPQTERDPAFPEPMTVIKSSRRLTAPSPGPFVTGSKDFTLLMWVRMDSATGYYARLLETSPYDSAARGLVLHVAPDLRPQFFVASPGGGNAIGSDAPLTLGVVYQLAFERYNNMGRLYVNGVPQSATLSLAGVSIGGTGFSIGANLSGGEGFYGLMGRIELHDSALFGGTAYTPSALLRASWLPMPGMPITRAAPGAMFAQDVEFGGTGTLEIDASIKGNPNNTPTRARVSVLRQRDKALARVAWSGADGKLSVPGLDLKGQQFVALAEYPSNPADPTAEGYMRPVAGVSKLEVS